MKMGLCFSVAEKQALVIDMIVCSSVAEDVEIVEQIAHLVETGELRRLQPPCVWPEEAVFC